MTAEDLLKILVRLAKSFLVLAEEAKPGITLSRHDIRRAAKQKNSK